MEEIVAGYYLLQNISSMRKAIIVINGVGGVGKDTLCSFVAKKYKTLNVSAVDPIKEAATVLGWDGRKDNRSRKFLSDLKWLSIQYNDYPTKYLLERYQTFLLSDNDVLFLHIREKEEIVHFIESVQTKVITLLIKKSQKNKQIGNYSDDNVEDYNYDYIYFNDKRLEEAEGDFLSFLESILNDSTNM